MLGGRDGWGRRRLMGGGWVGWRLGGEEASGWSQVWRPSGAGRPDPCQVIFFVPTCFCSWRDGTAALSENGAGSRQEAGRQTARSLGPCLPALAPLPSVTQRSPLSSVWVVTSQTLRYRSNGERNRRCTFEQRAAWGKSIIEWCNSRKSDLKRIRRRAPMVAQTRLSTCSEDPACLLDKHAEKDR